MPRLMIAEIDRLVGFIEDRLADAEAHLRDPRRGTGEALCMAALPGLRTCVQPPGHMGSLVHLRHDIAAKRMLLAGYHTDIMGDTPWDGDTEPVEERLWLYVVRVMASCWAEHPDYNGAWVP